MHHTINYNDFPACRRYEQALIDAQAWFRWDEPQVAQAVRQMAGQGLTLRQIINSLSIAGVKGLPARVYVLHALRTQ